MPVTIKQRVKFSVPPNKLYRFYMDPKLHGQFTGGKATVSTEAGSSFSVYGGTLKGKMLLAKSNKMIVQTWRGSDWSKDELDSILILTFTAIESGTELEMVHANVPDREAEDIRNGWREYYWTPWKEYIKTTQK